MTISAQVNPPPFLPLKRPSPLPSESCTVLPTDEELTLAAARIKAAHPLAYADAHAIAAALTHGATLVTGDPEIRHVRDRLDLTVCWSGR